MTHCAGCCGTSWDYWLDGLPAIGPDSLPCPGCSKCAEKDQRTASLEDDLRALAEAAAIYVGPSPSINDKTWPAWRETWLQSRERLQDALARPTVRQIMEQP